jgi:hypothetical protein
LGTADWCNAHKLAVIATLSSKLGAALLWTVATKSLTMRV